MLNTDISEGDSSGGNSTGSAYPGGYPSGGAPSGGTPSGGASSTGGDSSGGDSSGGDSAGGDSSGNNSKAKECKDIWSPRKCRRIFRRKSICSNYWFGAAHCAKSCNKCDEFTNCKDFAPKKVCEQQFLKRGRCKEKGPRTICQKTCGLCKWSFW